MTAGGSLVGGPLQGFQYFCLILLNFARLMDKILPFLLKKNVFIFMAY